MSENGLGVAFPYRHYEDYTSLKKNINGRIGADFIGDNCYEILIHGNQLSTASDARISSTNGSETVITSPLSKTEQTWVFAMSGDDVTVDGLIVTATFKNASGVETIVTGTLTSADNSVDQEFDTPITTGYALTALTMNGVATTADLWVGVTGMNGSNVNTMGIISNTAAAATEAQLHGVGDLFVRGELNHADSVDEDCYVDWMTPWGEVKRGGIATTNGTDGQTEERCLESNGTTTIKDAWFIIMFWAKLTDEPTSNSGFFFLTDLAVSNVDGSGGDVYGVINETEVASKHVSFTAPAGCDSWLGTIHYHMGIGNATGDKYQIKIHFTPKGESHSKVYPLSISTDHDEELVFPLAEGSECYFEIADTAGDSIISITALFISARRV